MPDTRERGPALRRLEAFEGTWRTNGEFLASGEPVPFSATDTYEWIPGRFFLLHRWSADMPDGRTEGVEVIGEDAAGGSYFMRAYDSRGNESVMRASVDGERWTFEGNGLRFTGGFRDDGRVFAGTWEHGAPGAWSPLMTVRLVKGGQG